MAVELILAPEAELDISDAYGWYENRRPGLGEEFLSCVDACIQRICRGPDSFAKVHEDYRRAIVRRFPYVIFYEHDSGKVVIYCVFHSARDPAKWRERLP
jgi:plasmid stabilization system protein ParE